MFHADWRAADRRCHARPEDRAGDMRGQGARRGPQVHSERFPFQTNPTSRLTPRTSSRLRRSPFYADFRCGFDVVFLAAFSFAGFLPEIASNIFLSGGRFLRLLRGFRGLLLADAPAQRLH